MRRKSPKCNKWRKKPNLNNRARNNKTKTKINNNDIFSIMKIYMKLY